MNYSIRYRIAATILGLLVIGSLSGSRPTAAVASSNQPGIGDVSSTVTAKSSLNSAQAAELRGHILLPLKRSTSPSMR
jgi:hypothetical protein